MKIKLFSTIIVLALVAGCTTTGEPDVTRISIAVQEAARIGTTEALRDRPEWRVGFETARNELNILGAKDKLTVSDLLEAISRLPVSELSSDTARLAFEGARLTIAIIGWSDTEVVQTAQVRPVVLALAGGITAGLNVPVASSVAERSVASSQGAPTKRHYKAK